MIVDHTPPSMRPASAPAQPLTSAQALSRYFQQGPDQPTEILPREMVVPSAPPLVRQEAYCESPMSISTGSRTMSDSEPYTEKRATVTVKIASVQVLSEVLAGWIDACGDVVVFVGDADERCPCVLTCTKSMLSDLLRGLRLTTPFVLKIQS